MSGAFLCDEIFRGVFSGDEGSDGFVETREEALCVS
jgi:hypothetical protein